MRIAIAGATGLVGSQLATAVEVAGHQVVALSKEGGVDVLRPDGLADRLAGVDALVDVTQSPTLDETEAASFFARGAQNLGEAAYAAGVRRTVVLSIIGVDVIAASSEEAGTGFDGYYRAKHVHELATTAHAPGAHVVRSAQFHDIARQAIGWGRDGARTTVPNLLTQPVAVESMVRVLLRAATGEVAGPPTEVAGPRRERLPALSKAFAAHAGDPVEVQAGPVGAAVDSGVLLPGPGALLVGPDFAEWLDTVITVTPSL